jgi:hypothetical protein
MELKYLLPKSILNNFLLSEYVDKWLGMRNIPGKMYLLWYFGAVITKDCCEMPSLSTQAWLTWVLWNHST